MPRVSWTVRAGSCRLRAAPTAISRTNSQKQRFFIGKACEIGPILLFPALRRRSNFGNLAADLLPLFGQGGPAFCVPANGRGDKYKNLRECNDSSMVDRALRSACYRLRDLGDDV